MNTKGVAPTGSPNAGAAIVDGQGHVRYVSPQEAADYRTKGFLNRVGQIAPYGIMGLMGYGALTGGTGTIAGLRAASGGIQPGLITNTAPSLGEAVAPTGASMKFGLGSLAKFFDSRGGTAAIDAGSNLIGSRMQIGAANRAADIQSQYANRALDWSQQQYGRARDEYGAWLNGGEVAQLGALLRSLPGASQPPTSRPQTMTMGQMRSAGTGQTPGAAASGPMVTLQAPTGETQQFAVNDPRIQQHLDRGARRVA